MATDLGSTAALRGTVASDVAAALYAQLISGVTGGNVDATAAYDAVLTKIAKQTWQTGYPLLP